MSAAASAPMESKYEMVVGLEVHVQLRTRTKRTALLRGARSAEANASWAEARRLYQGAAFDDT